MIGRPLNFRRVAISRLVKCNSHLLNKFAHSQLIKYSTLAMSLQTQDFHVRTCGELTSGTAVPSGDMR